MIARLTSTTTCGIDPRSFRKSWRAPTDNLRLFGQVWQKQSALFVHLFQYTTLTDPASKPTFTPSTKF
jgi:hypothetical protein